MIHSEVSSCHACIVLHSDVLSWTQKPRAEDPPRMQLVMLKIHCLLQIYIYIYIYIYIIYIIRYITIYIYLSLLVNVVTDLYLTV